MPQDRISATTVKKLVCPAGKDREFLWDDDIAGFGVCAFPSGKKTYVIQFRKDGLSRRATIGKHGRLTPDQARSEAKKLLGAIETGENPIEKRREARAVRTFREVANDFLEMHVKAKRKGRTVETYQTLLDRHVLPAIGSKRVADIRRADVSTLHGKMKDTPGAANRAVALIKAIWNWSATKDEIAAADNPAKGIERYREHAKERFLTPGELARLGDALRQAEAIGLPWAADETKPKAKHLAAKENRVTKIDPHAAGAIRLLILTGARLREILHLRHADIDASRGIAFLQDSKTGKKPLYLSAAALEVIAGLPKVEGNPFIIVGRIEGQPRHDLNKPWAAVTRAAGLEGVRIHDLRHSFASFGAGASLGLPIIGKLLGHSQAATTHRYAHLDADPMRRAVETIGSTITAAMNRSAPAEVVKLDDARSSATRKVK